MDHLDLFVCLLVISVHENIGVLTIWAWVGQRLRDDVQVWVRFSIVSRHGAFKFF